jgi:hypothetical protein
MRPFLLSLFLLFSCTTILAQLEIQDKDQFISTRAYNQKISYDLNYLLLGENSPQQGISVSVNGTKSNLKISGLLYSGNYGILTTEADLAASNGIYFFDQENGSEQGKITINYFKPLKISTEKYTLKGYSKANIKLQTLELIRKAKIEYLGIKTLAVKVFGEMLFESNDADEAIKKLKEIAEEYINKDDSKGYHQLVGEFNEDSYNIKLETDKTKTETQNNEGAVIIKNFKKDEDLIIEKANEKSITKLLKAYDSKRQYILKKLEDSINNLELQSVKSKWAATHIIFMGISPFYERQSFKRFLYDDTLSFADMFTTERGNVYGVTLSINYNLSKEEGSLNIFKPQNLFVRASLTFSRASNISNFRNSTLDLTTPLGNDVNGNPVTFTTSDNAFIGDTAYEYGFGSAFDFETYYYPFKVPIGFFAKIGYKNISFNKISNLKDKELYPMRLGLLFNLKNKKKDSPVITLQTFIDRTDLNLSPNGQDQDLRFGLGVGLPINIK